LGTKLGGLDGWHGNHTVHIFSAGTDFTRSEHNDEFYMDEAGNVKRHGLIDQAVYREGYQMVELYTFFLNAEIIYFKVAFRPTTTIGVRPVQNKLSLFP